MESLRSEKISDRLNIARSFVTPELYDSIGNQINKDFQDYKAAIAETVSHNLQLLDELPPLRNLSLNELKEHFKKLLEGDLKKDTLFERSVEIKKYVSNISKYVVDYFRKVFDHNNDCKERLNSDIFDTCRMFFNSDLPLSYLTAVENAILIQRDFLDVYEKLLHKERLELLLSKNNRKKFKRLCSNHNKWVDQFGTKIDEIESIRIKLFWYIDFSNSKTVEDIFKVKTIKSSSLDMKVLQDFTSSLQRLTNEVELLIQPKIEFKPIISYEDNSGTRAIRKIMELLSIAEG
jgi:hypothetical protein